MKILIFVKQIVKNLKEINEKMDKLDEKVERRYHDILKIFDSYEIATENMYQENKQKIEFLQRQLKIANI